MPANRKRHAVEAVRERWLLLGELLQARRQETGYRHRPAFARERLAPTDDGNPNVRLVADIEMGYRNTFPPGTLREIARAYEVTYDSLTAVLAARADTLEPAVPPAPVTRLPPMADAARIASARPYADAINRRLRELAGRGLPDPAGAQVFPSSPADAKTWDGIGARLDIDDRVWFIADLQRRAHDRDGHGEPETAPL